MQTKSVKSEWIPAQSKSPNLMIVLHGRGDSPAGFHWLPSALGFQDMNYLLLEAPDRYYMGFSWYDLPPDQGPGILRSRALLDRLLDETNQAGYRVEDTILFGFSQGCLMTLEWAGRSDHRLRACIGISGYCYDPEALSKELSPAAKEGRWMITHGTQDDILDFHVTEKQVKYLQEKGLPIRFKCYPKTHTIDDREELPDIREFIKQAFRG